MDNQPFYEMANFFPKNTGLPITIWTSIKYKNLNPRVKILDEECKVSISIEDEPKVLVGKCNSNKIIKQVFKWIKLNKNVLLDYWYQKIDTVELVKNLKSLKD